MSGNTSTETVVCALCLKPCNEDCHCFGCNHYICDDCDRSPPIGKHAREDHLYDEQGRRRPR